MKILLLFILSIGCTIRPTGWCISTLDFLETANKNKDEAYFHYRNNWKKLRETAIEMGYIQSYEILEMIPTDEAPFHHILITTYANAKAYAEREDRFDDLIEQAGELRLLNSKKPLEFR